VLGLVGLLGLAQGGPGTQRPDQCSMQCGQVYSLHTSQYEQVLPSLQACQQGCQFFSRIEAKNGFHDSLGNLQNCNYSCDERFEGALVPACQSGCGFHFDSDVTVRRSSQGPPAPAPVFTRGPPPSAPTFPRARGPAFARSQGPPRPGPTVLVSEESPRSWPAETPRASMQSEMVVPPRVPMMRSDNPLLNMLRSQGPVMMRPQSFNMTPQRVTPMLNGPPSPQGNMVTKDNPRGPTIIGFSLPQLLSRVQSILPSMEQAMPRMQQNMQKMPTMDIFSRMENQEMQEDNTRENRRPSLEFSLPSMEQIFARIGEAMPDMEQHEEPLMNRVMEIEIENPFDEFEQVPRMNMPRIPGEFFGIKDQDDDFGFSGLFDQLTNHVMSSQFSQSWSPFGEAQDAGKLTIIKAGPGFHEEQHFDIGPDGRLVEITEAPVHQDALEHENPMDVHFNSNDVEIFHTDDDAADDIFELADVEKTEKASEPVMDVWAVEEEGEEAAPKTTEGPEALPQVKAVEFSAKEYPFLDILRNTVEENERMSQQLLNRYRTLADREYRDDYTCNSEHLKWSDWVACLHARVGVPRWLTAATISLGIVFSVWLCLVIPTAAPKQRLRALVIRTDKPSSALAKAKEAEATAKACEAAGVDLSTVVSVVRVDLPPSYGEVRPSSPAPSYKSEMGVPGSPAPSYRSVDIPAEDTKEKTALEPVHGESTKPTKEILA
jgi:hypothetical protein